MISTRSGEGKTFHLLSVLILLSAESSTTPTHQPSNGSSTQQFLADQMQLIQNLTTTISKHSSLAKSVTTSSTTSTGGQA
jgi:hypothetical protein